MIDIPAIKSRLSDPREVARLLGLRVMGPQARGVMVACPAHGNRSGSMSLRSDGGIVRAHCFGCGFHGDVIDLLGAIERDPRRGLARAADLAGGAAPMARVEVVHDERLPAEVYHELAERILDAGRLDGRSWVREVEAYLKERRLLELARADGWACLPGLNWLLQIAEEVCDANSRDVLQADRESNSGIRRDKTVLHASNVSSGSVQSRSAQSGVLTPSDLLIRAKLAQYNKRGEFVPAWGRWLLVIPWRGTDGRISALQRRRTWKHVPRDENDPEPAKYVLPWLPDWPYGSERVDYGQERIAKEVGCALGRNDISGVGKVEYRSEGRQANASYIFYGTRGGVGRATTDPRLCVGRKVAIVEGAVDVLAMRAMHPGFVVLGIPGINNWRSSWASLVAGHEVRFALDRGKPDPHGIVPEDRACAKIALDVAQAAWQASSAASAGTGSSNVRRGMAIPGGCSSETRAGAERTPANGIGPALEKSGAFAFSFTDLTLDWLISRHRRGKTLFCVLCGAPEPWLCRGCGRRRAPVGMDWGEVWWGKRQL